MSCFQKILELSKQYPQEIAKTNWYLPLLNLMSRFANEQRSRSFHHQSYEGAVIAGYLAPSFWSKGSTVIRLHQMTRVYDVVADPEDLSSVITKNQ
ncbi:MAG: hypothetical protein HWD59_01225 [Coxiellaceae bacterium]|nr:MAG: hypothetical protein HWD59_01225 [Coxiellaceae bacterium]